MVVDKQAVSSGWHIRPGVPSDAAFLADALYEAAFWRVDQERPSRQEMLGNSHLSRYVRNWGRPTDTGVIAEDDAGNAIGAAWYRLLDETEPGYGFVNALTPEISIAVLPGYRGRGIGRSLMAVLIQTARIANIRSLSLSVAPDNPAVALYQQVGFRFVDAGPDAPTRDSLTMQLDLKPEAILTDSNL